MAERRPLVVIDGQVQQLPTGDTLPGGGGGGASTFLDLTDTPASYTGQGGNFLAVNIDENAVEWVNPPAGGGSGETFIAPAYRYLNSTETSMSSTAYATKGAVYTMTADRLLYRVDGFFTVGQTIKLVVAELSTTPPLSIISILYDGTPKVISEQDTSFPLETPITLEAGKTYGFMWVRTDGTATTILAVPFNSNNKRTDVDGGFEDPSFTNQAVRYESNNPQVGDIATYDSTLYVRFEFYTLDSALITGAEGVGNSSTTLLATNLFSPNTETGNGSSSAYATKGYVAETSVASQITGCRSYIGGAGTYMVVLAKMTSADNSIIESILGTSSTVILPGAGYVDFHFASPVSAAVGDFIGVLLVRTDAGATGANNIYFNNGNSAATDGVFSYTLSVRYASVAPLVGDDVNNSNPGEANAPHLSLIYVTQQTVDLFGSSGASTLGALTDVDVTDTTEGHVLTRKADGSFNFQPPPAGGGGGGAGALDDLSDVSFDHTLIGPALLNRPLGIVQTSPSVQVGVLGELSAIPISGGAETLVEHDLSSNPLNQITIPDAHLYDEIVVVGRGITASLSVNLLILPNGLDPANATMLRHRIFAENAAPTTALATASNVQSLFMAQSGSNISFIGRFTGMKPGTPFRMERVSATISTNYYHNEFSLTDIYGEVQELQLHSLNNMTAGVVYVIGIRYSAQPLIAPFDYVGSPSGAATLARFVLPIGAKLRNGPQGQFVVTTNPTTETVIEVRKNGTSVGTITIPATTGTPVVSVPTTTDFAAGDIITLASTAAGDFTDIFGSLILEGLA